MAAPVAEPDFLPALFVLYKSSSNLMHILPLLYQEVTLKTKLRLIKIFILSRRGRREMERECGSHECEVEILMCQRGSPTPNYHESLKDRS